MTESRENLEFGIEELARMSALVQFADRERFDASEIPRRTERLADSIVGEFRGQNEMVKAGLNIEAEIANNCLTVTFSKPLGDARSIEIPLPYITRKGIELLGRKDVIRVMCDFWLERTQERLHYHEIMERLLVGNVNDILPFKVTKGGSCIAQLVRAFSSHSIAFMTAQVQKLINEIVNHMPLHETDMNSWAMNHRIVVVDPEFDAISDPNQRLEYQVRKNLKYYERFGWTAIGLSDGVLADKNYLLTIDLRKHIPFGMYHNPQRNLYSTLGMKGDEIPRIRSASMEAALKRGVSRHGWNLNTAILDTPLNFEDQILVDNRLRGLFSKTDRRYIIYGTKVIVKNGDSIKFNDVLGYSNDGKPVRVQLKAEEMKVIGIRRDTALINGEKQPIVIVKIRGKRFLKDGSKFSNLHGNKGVIKFVNLGHAISPVDGKETPIDVMFGGSSANRRKNFGQILEALLNIVHPGDAPIILNDDVVISKTDITDGLKRVGYPEDGTCMISTYCGEHSAIVGKMFWGVTKDPEDSLWEEDKTETTNNKELRVAGLKISHVEMKALVTRFGIGNPILSEILSHSQGVEILQDELRIVQSAMGKVDSSYPTVDVSDVTCVDTSKGLFHSIDAIAGTVVDEAFLPEGFVLRLPFYVQSTVDKKNKEKFTIGLPHEVPDKDEKDIYVFNTLFVPNSLLRRSWHHGSGKWGLSTIGAQVNSIVRQCHKYQESFQTFDHLLAMNSVSRYLVGVAKSMGSKNGELSTYGMAVRYPFSRRAKAGLSDALPKNTVEIHRDMAKELKVKTGDVVLIERFPCMGFMSIRPQWVKVTDDPMCKYVIRASGNSLVSLTLDFDGDDIYIASFHTPQAIEALHNEMTNPNRLCEDAIEKINAKKIPELKEMSLDDFAICEFPKPTNEEHSELVRKATGVKSHTGPVIALAYNLMRIVEANVPYDKHPEQHVHLELLLDFLGNTVFKQKHGIRSLQEEATDAICTADVDAMVNLGFERMPSELLCDLIRKEAATLNIRDLKRYHTFVKENGGSKIINLIVRRKNRVYFATRSTLGPFSLLDHLSDKPRDLPSFMLFNILRSKREKIEDKLDRMIADRMKIKDVLMTTRMKEIYVRLSQVVDEMMGKNKTVDEPRVRAAQTADKRRI